MIKTPLRQGPKLHKKKAPDRGAFLSMKFLLLLDKPFFNGLFQHRSDALFGHHANGVGRDLEGDIPILFRNIETFDLKVWEKSSSGFMMGVRNIVSAHHTLAG
jgi:hypothetical protein